MARGIVDGTVTKIIRSGGGAMIRETWQNRNGITKSRNWTAWAPDGQSVPVRVGDLVTVSGRLSVKVSPRDNRYIDTSLQAAAFTLIEAADEGEVRVDVPISLPVRIVPAAAVAEREGVDISTLGPIAFVTGAAE
jgi:hypothetical protein